MSELVADSYDPKRMDTYDYTRRPSWVRRFLWFCAGADADLLRRCPKSEWVKEEGIGGIVLATAMLAFMSGSYALYVVFGPKVGLALSAEQQQVGEQIWPMAIGFGLVWSLIIFNLDRFVVSSTGHGDGTDAITWGEFGRAIPRIIMAVIIGLCLAKPLEIRVMESEINAEINKRQREKIEEGMKQWEQGQQAEISKKESMRNDVRGQLRKIDADLADLKKIADQLAQDHQAEIAGGVKRGATGIAGDGPAARAAQAKMEKAYKDLDAERTQKAPEIARLKEQDLSYTKDLDSIEARRSEAKRALEIEAKNQDGLFTRIKIAHEKGGTISTLLTLLLMIIEVGPIFFKMMMPRGPYHSLSDNQVEIVRAKNAIATERIVAPGEETDGESRDRFHRAETILEFEAGTLATERRLAAHARKRFEEATMREIDEDPYKFISKKA